MRIGKWRMSPTTLESPSRAVKYSSGTAAERIASRGPRVLPAVRSVARLRARRPHDPNNVALELRALATLSRMAGHLETIKRVLEGNYTDASDEEKRLAVEQLIRVCSVSAGAVT